MKDKDLLLMAYAVLDDMETCTPSSHNLTEDEKKMVAGAKDVLARQYTALTLADCRYDGRHNSEFFTDELRSDIIAYHKRADEWPDITEDKEEDTLARRVMKQIEKK